MSNEKQYPGVDAGPKQRKMGSVSCASEAPFGYLFDHNLDAVFFTSPDGTVWDANPAACAMLGMSKEEICRAGRAGVLDCSDPRLPALLEERKRQGKISCEMTWIRKDGSKFPVEVSSVILEPENGLVRSFVIARDITERKQAEQANRQLAAIVNSSTDAIVGKALDGTILSWNAGAERLYGFSAAEAVGKPISILVPTDQADELLEVLARIGRGERITHYETLRRRKDGSLIDVSLTISPVLDEQGRVIGASATARDISDRKRLEWERHLPMEFLRLVNSSTGTKELIQSATGFFQEQSGCEAVGIRLRSGDDYPYFETHGFPRSFIEAENSLCVRCENGEPQHDGSGNPLLDCMCGNVICGRFDPSKPFFTPCGSFWTNCTTALLANTLETDRQARTRNRCNGEGYESVALIPLASGKHRLGLLQLNDHRKGRFTAESIALWERLAGYLAMAIAKSQAEEAMRASEERYHSLFDQMTEGFALHEIVCDEHGEPCDYRFLDVNAAFEQLTGLKRSQVIGKTMREILPGEKPDWITTYGAVALTGQPVRFESHAVALGRDYEVFAYRPAPRRFAVIFSDVTKRKQAEDLLATEATRRRILIEGSRDGIVVLDQHGKVFEANRQFAKMLGYTAEEVRQLHVWDWDRDWPRERVLEAIRTLGPEGARFETRHWRKDGSCMDIDLSINAAELRGQKLVFCVCHDITDRKQAEQERLDMERRMLHAQKLEGLGVLAGGIAHDFNNILAGIMGYAELLKRSLPPSERAREDLEVIEKAVRRAADLTRQMLAYSGKGKFVVEPVSLSRVVEDSRKLLAMSVSKKANVTYDLTADLPMTLADASQICQVLMNLVINASEALGEQSGTIAVSTGASYFQARRLSGIVLGQDMPDGPAVYLEVTDTGCGMNQETLSKVFDPFFTTKFTGRGLGLAAVHGIVRGHKGAIQVLSESGKGTTFRVYFPAIAAVPVASTESTAMAFRGSGMILVADDEEIVRTLAQRMIEELGFSVLTARDGEEAIHLYRQYQDDVACLILDLTMPKMNGEETFRELRKIRPDVRVVLSSGYAEEGATERFAGLGLAGFLQKPYQFDTMAMVLRKALGER